VGRKLQISFVLALFALLALAVGAYAWDSSKHDQIADGVTIGGIDVGGMDTDQARKVINEELVDPIDKPITVKFQGTRYVLNPEKLGIGADVKGMVNRALAASQDGGLPTRVWRYISGGEVDKSIDPRFSYDQDAIDEFIAKVADDVNHDAVNASVEPTASSVDPVAGKPGVTLDEGKLKGQITDAVQDPARRLISAQDDVDEVQPKVTTKDLAADYPTYLTVDRANFTLKLWKNLKLVKTYSVAIGAEGFDTPTGLYHIQDKAVDPVWTVPDSAWAGDLAGKVIPGGVPENPLKARWLGIFDGAGIHGTDDDASIGSAASHGCVRMHIADVIDLYPRVPVGTPIYIG
jgi:lipoprotein-anchoring transpeptidase ErfK/SrfK